MDNDEHEGEACNEEDFNKAKRNDIFARYGTWLIPYMTLIYIKFPRWKKEELKRQEPKVPDWTIESRFLRFHLPFKKDGQLPGPSRAYCIFFFSVYLICKTFIHWMVYKNFEKSASSWDRSNWSLDVKLKYGGLNNTDKCIILDHLSEENQAKAKLVNYWSQILKLIGSPDEIVNDFWAFGTGMFTFVNIILLTFARYANANESYFKTNTICFYENPLIERRRLAWLSSDLLKRLWRAMDKSRQWSSVFETISASNDQDSKMDLVTIETRRLLNNQKRQHSKVYENNLNHMENFFLPAHLTLRSYKCLVSKVRLTSIVHILISIFIGVIAFGGFINQEIHKRAEKRIEQVECKLWNSLAVSRKWPTQIDLPRSSELNEDHPSAWEVEFILFFTSVPTIQFLIEMIISYWILMAWCFYYLFLVVTNYHSQSIWLDQIQSQLHQIPRQIESCLNIKESHLCSHESIAIKKELIDQSLGLTYVNFVLYTRELRYYKMIFEFLFLQMVLLIMGSALCGFSSLSSISDSNYKALFWIIIIAVILILNVMVYLTVSTTTQLLNLFKVCNGIMAKASQIGMQHSYIINLWRRQILSKRDFQLTFGSNILGLELSRSNMMSFNSYLLGGLLYLYRKSI